MSIHPIRSFVGEYKKFVNRGNVVDMAVGVIIGGAFTAIVTAVSVIPFAIFARVFPVHGATIKALSGIFGPSGSAASTV